MMDWKSILQKFQEDEPRLLEFAVVALPEKMPGEDRVRAWVNKGFHAGMEWFSRTLEQRVAPAVFAPGMKSAVVILWKYPEPLAPILDSAEVRISSYAQGEDYHYEMGAFLRKVLSQFQSDDPALQGRVFVDAQPVLERELAVLAGLGWIGKNSLLFNRKWGSAFFIGGILLDQEWKSSLVQQDFKYLEHCGNCRICIDACPTQAITEYRSVNANQCISYLTIEHKGELTSSIDNWLFGCDICQSVCPWNRRNVTSPVPNERFWPDSKEAWLELLTPGHGLRQRIKGTPLDRIGRKGLATNFANLLDKSKTL